MKVKVKWAPFDGEPLMRQEVNPEARQGYRAVNLAYVRKHAKVSHYRVKWWEGETDTEGRWETRDFPAGTNLADVKIFAQMIAAWVSRREVEISLWGQAQGNIGWEGARVWTFGHYLRVGGGETLPAGSPR